MSSVLFGLKKFSISKEAVAMIFGGLSEPSPRWTVRLLAGSRATGQTITVEPDRLHLIHPALGKITVATKDVVEICLSPRLVN